MDSRLQFEKWQQGFYTYPLDTNRHLDGHYLSPVTQGAFDIWQAALAATGKQRVDGTCDHCENGVAVNSNSRTKEPCRHCKQVGAVQGDARAQFEAWAHSESLSLHKSARDGEYNDARTISAWLAWKAALAARQPGAQVPRADLVPGIVRCAKCTFQLSRTILYIGSGTVGAGDSKTEPCPNGCGPLWPVTWETWAREGWAEAERLHMEKAAAPPAQGWQHIANEWADAATNGVQWLRNIRDGASTVADALVCMEGNVERIQQLKPEVSGE